MPKGTRKGVSGNDVRENGQKEPPLPIRFWVSEGEKKRNFFEVSEPLRRLADKQHL